MTFSIRTTLVFVSLLGSVVHGADESAKTDKSVVGTWQGTLSVGAVELRLAFHITKEKDGSLKGTLDSIDQGAKGIPIDNVTFADNKLTLDLPKLKASFVGELNEDKTLIKGKFTQGAKFNLTLKRVEKVTELKRPQHPKKPYPYREEEVTVENAKAKVTLAGTLTFPKGDGPFPAAILITGSGPQDRDESLLGHKPFLVLADHLTRKGIAVLRYDDRGVAKSTGDFAETTSVDTATDVAALFDYLTKRKEIDPKRVGLIGHSEGGIIAPMVAVEKPEVAFAVLLATTGVDGEKVVLSQGDAIMKAMGADKENRKRLDTLRKQLFEAVRKGASADDLKKLFEEFVKGLPEKERKEFDEVGKDAFDAQLSMLTSKWLKPFLEYDPAVTLKKVRCPVLVLFAEKDLQVLPSVNRPAIEKALKEAGNKRATVKEFPKLNHLFQECKTGLPSEYGKIEQTIAPVVLETISTWIERTVPEGDSR